MKKKNNPVPAVSKLNLLRQICSFIAEFMVSQIARETQVDEKARTFTPWSHVVSLLYAQLTHSIGLNDVCDALQLHSGPLSSIRGATPPTRNSLSHADKVRPSIGVHLPCSRTSRQVCDCELTPDGFVFPFPPNC